jgi:hypothetical protein
MKIEKQPSMKHIVPVDRVIAEIICVQPMVAGEYVAWHYLLARHCTPSVAFLLLPGKSGQHMTQPVGRPTSMKPQIGLHDADASSMPFLQQPISWPSVKVARHARGQQRMKNPRDRCTDL